MFAKLFESEENGQVLVTKGENDEDQPQINFTFEFDGGVCKFSPTYKGDTDGYEQRDKYFDELTETRTFEIVEKMKISLFG